jgi:hypothetical protein
VATDAPETPPEQQVPDKPTEATPEGEIGGSPKEDFTGKFDELQRTISALEERTRRAEHNAEYFRTLVEGKQEPKKDQVEPESQPSPVSPDEFWKNPVGVFDQLFDRKLETMEKRRKAESEQKERQDMVRKAQDSYNTGWDTSMKRRPALYKGIEDIVRREVYNSLNSGHITPDQARMPEIWDFAANMVRNAQGEYDLTKYYKPTPKAAPPVSTERPGAKVPPKEQPQLSEMEMMVAKAAGQTPEQFIAAKVKLHEEEG